MPLISAGKTDIGQKRSTNEDSIFLSDRDRFYIVADGMGGHNGGDIASQMAVKILPNFALPNIHREKNIEAYLKAGLLYTNEQIRQEGQKNPKLMGMGTTVNMSYFKGSHIFVTHVGDSRTYLINKSQIYQLTIDHNLIQEKLNLGIYDRIQAAKDPHKNVLTRTVGFEEQVEVDVYRYQISRGDMFLHCSDGLYGKVSDEDVIYVINKFIPNPLEGTQEAINMAVETLVDQANKNGGNDNISVILILAK